MASEERINDMEERLAQVGKKLSTIDDIAKQIGGLKKDSPDDKDEVSSYSPLWRSLSANRNYFSLYFRLESVK
jgi:hypothetical protein